VRNSVVIALCVLTALVHSHARALAASGDYWQQHVHYTIEATLIDSIHSLDGRVSVVYTNNSPDTLHEVFFHLYSNAFQHGSLMEERAKAEDSWLQYRMARLGPSEEGRYWIDNVSVNDRPVSFEITGTIMRIALAEPLTPGASISIALPFREQIPLQTRRSGWMSDQGVLYSMAQWYPKIAEYDREGWQAQEYVSHEFYGVWGEFDVTLHVPSRFTVGSSGECQNPEEAGHGYERIGRGEKEGREEPHSDATGMTTWKFHAAPVHDFAWVADEYVHDWKTWNDSVTIHALYKPNVAPGWQDALKYTEFALATYSELYGQWPYRNFSTTESGDGGMEYPQLIMCNNGGASLIAHEAGHQWFYGLLGSNETREAFMDEGFTQYVASVEMQRQFGRYLGSDANRSWLEWFVPMFDNKSDNFRSYQSLARSGYEEPLVIPHDWFREGVNAGQVYMKTLSGLNMLEYALGDSVFARGMKDYYAAWHFKHPHLLDFQRVMERTSGTDLDWFFDQWFRTTRTIDYGAIAVDSRPSGNAYETTVHLRNNELGVMPLDLLLHNNDGTTEQATIPLSVNKGLAYHKSGVSLFFPAWDWPAKEYIGSIATPKHVDWFEIDTSWRLQDLNWLNNSSSRGPLWMPKGYWRVWQNLPSRPPLDGYYAVARPILWYSDANGFEGGAGVRYGINESFSGDIKLTYKAKPLSGDTSLLAHLDGRWTYSAPVDWLGRLSNVSLRAEKIDGISTLRAELKKTFRPEFLYFGATHSGGLALEHQRLLDAAYPMFHHDWSLGATESGTLWYAIASGSTNFEISAESALPGSDRIYSRAESHYETSFSTLFSIPLKIRASIATASQQTPMQKLSWLARANPVAEQTADFYRGLTNVSARFDANEHPFIEGGAGVRGYNTLDSSEVGRHALGVSLDFGLPNPLERVWKPLRMLSPILFADAGWVNHGSTDLFGDLKTNLRTDLGLKISVDLLTLLPSQLHGVADEYAAIPAIGITFPFYLNHPTDGSSPFAFRCALSIGASL
jgi:hypothetical protein